MTFKDIATGLIAKTCLVLCSFGLLSKAKAQRPDWHKEGSNIPKAGFKARPPAPPPMLVDTNHVQFSAGLQGSLMASNRIAPNDLVAPPMTVTFAGQLQNPLGKKYLLLQARTDIGAAPKADAHTTAVSTVSQVQAGVGLSNVFSSRGGLAQVFTLGGVAMTTQKTPDKKSVDVSPTAGAFLSVSLFQINKGAGGSVNLSCAYTHFFNNKEHGNPGYGTLGVNYVLPHGRKGYGND